MTSLRRAINDKCRDCIYDPLARMGSWRQQTDGCPSLACPLHPVRPRSRGRKAPILAVGIPTPAGDTPATSAPLNGAVAPHPVTYPETSA